MEKQDCIPTHLKVELGYNSKMDMDELHFHHYPVLEEMTEEQRYDYVIGLLRCHIILFSIVLIIALFNSLSTEFF